MIYLKSDSFTFKFQWHRACADTPTEWSLCGTDPRSCYWVRTLKIFMTLVPKNSLSESGSIILNSDPFPASDPNYFISKTRRNFRQSSLFL